MRHSGTYRPIDAREIPQRVRFDVPRRNQGQIIEIAYGTFGHGEADAGDLYRRRLDRSVGPDTYEYSVRVCDGCHERHDAWTDCVRRKVSRRGVVSWSR